MLQLKLFSSPSNLNDLTEESGPSLQQNLRIEQSQNPRAFSVLSTAQLSALWMWRCLIALLPNFWVSGAFSLLSSAAIGLLTAVLGDLWGCIQWSPWKSWNNFPLLPCSLPLADATLVSWKAWGPSEGVLSILLPWLQPSALYSLVLGVKPKGKELVGRRKLALGQWLLEILIYHPSSHAAVTSFAITSFFCYSLVWQTSPPTVH